MCRYGHECARATLALTLLFLAPIDELDDDDDDGDGDGGGGVDEAVLQQQQQTLAGMSALDLGCGNGLFCCMLASAGVGRVVGLDYADSAIELAGRVREVFAAAVGDRCVFEQKDVLGGGGVQGQYDLVHDCGLVDSVAMVRDAAVHEVAAVVARALKPQGIFVCRSCNHR